MNGMGSKGALLAPWLSAHLADHLDSKSELSKEVDIRRFNT